MKTMHIVSIEWHDLSEEKPPKDLFFPCLIVTPEGIRIARYVGDNPTPDQDVNGRSVVDGFIRGGWWFTSVSAWALLNDILSQMARPSGFDFTDEGGFIYPDEARELIANSQAELAEAKRMIAAYDMTFENNRAAIDANQGEQ